MIAFGPVPSRRLGASLGINNVPPKVCTYSCVYCQLGRTQTMRVDRQEFYAIEQIVDQVGRKVAEASAQGEEIDYLTFVSDGEPTLAADLGKQIQGLRSLGLPIAVISNASLIWREDVRDDLLAADWVSLKVDAVDEPVWREIDRPHGRLVFGDLLAGAMAFAGQYDGVLATETMLVAGVNDGVEHLQRLAQFLACLAPDRPYLAIPTRPPAEDWVRAPGEATINNAYQTLSEHVKGLEYLIGYEGNAFASTGDVEADLLSITSVHPMRQDAVDLLLRRAGADWSSVATLVETDQLVESVYQDRAFYVRKLAR